ncbi:MAG: hypothetical protein ACREBJ_11430, partial [Nitrosotalea sp.]
RRYDHEKRLQQLERARRIKKELQELKSQIITDVNEEMIFDEPVQENGNADQEIHDKTDTDQAPPKK